VYVALITSVQRWIKVLCSAWLRRSGYDRSLSAGGRNESLRLQHCHSAVRRVGGDLVALPRSVDGRQGVLS
jgi:hypothetical protein